MFQRYDPFANLLTVLSFRSDGWYRHGQRACTTGAGSIELAHQGYAGQRGIRNMLSRHVQRRGRSGCEGHSSQGHRCSRGVLLASVCARMSTAPGHKPRVRSPFLHRSLNTTLQTLDVYVSLFPGQELCAGAAVVHAVKSSLHQLATRPPCRMRLAFPHTLTFQAQLFLCLFCCSAGGRLGRCLRHALATVHGPYRRLF